MDYIKKQTRKHLIESIGEIWYHGSPDVREIEKSGGFTHKTFSVPYIKDIDGYYKVQNDLKIARQNGDDTEYHRLLDTVNTFKDNYVMGKPVFLSNDRGVANTYVNKPSFDYQNSEPKLLMVRVTTNSVVKINAPGDRFRFIDVNKVKRGFLASGTSEKDFDDLLPRLNFYQQSKEGIKTDMVAVLGHWLGYDCIDVIGVLDSYNGGSVKSTVRMVLNHEQIEIVK